MHKEMAAVGIKATKMFPGNAELHHTTAISLHQVGQYKESEEHHNEAIKLKPKEQRYYLQLGTCVLQVTEHYYLEPCSSDPAQNICY